MRAREYPLLKQTIDRTMKHAWTRAHQQDAEPSEDRVIAFLAEAMLAALCETFVVEGAPEGKGA